MTSLPVVSDLDVAWLAGLLEGEGTFLMYRNHVGGRVYRYPKVAVNMTDEDIIERVAALFGTKVYVMPQYVEGRKQQWRAHATGSNAAAWMRRLYPLLGQRRRARIDEVLAEYDACEPTDDRRRKSCKEATLRRERDSATGQFVAVGQ